MSKAACESCPLGLGSAAGSVSCNQVNEVGIMIVSGAGIVVFSLGFFVVRKSRGHKEPKLSKLKKGNVVHESSPSHSLVTSDSSTNHHLRSGNNDTYNRENI